MPWEPVIELFDTERHHSGVVELWANVFGYETAHNEPALSIRKKLEAGDGLFFVAEDPNGAVVGSVMGGYDGHRGWIYSLAVAGSSRGSGLGSQLVRHVEAALLLRGCLKVNLQINEGNAAVVDFYERLGYTVEPRISMGKSLADS